MSTVEEGTPNVASHQLWSGTGSAQGSYELLQLPATGNVPLRMHFSEILEQVPEVPRLWRKTGIEVIFGTPHKGRAFEGPVRVGRESHAGSVAVSGLGSHP